MKNINGCILKVFLTLMIISMGSLVWASENEGGEWHLLSPSTIQLKAGDTTHLTLGLDLHGIFNKDKSIKQVIEIQGASFVIDPYTGKSEFESTFSNSALPTIVQIDTKMLEGNKLTSKLVLKVDNNYWVEEQIIDKLAIYREPGQKGDVTLTFNHDPNSKITLKTVEKLPVGVVKPSIHILGQETHNLYGTTGQILLKEDSPGQIEKGSIEIIVDGNLNIDDCLRGIEASKGDIEFRVWRNNGIGNKVWLEITKPSTVSSTINLIVEKYKNIDPFRTKQPFRSYDVVFLGQNLSKNDGALRQIIKDWVVVTSDRAFRSKFLDEAVFYKTDSEGYLVGKEYYPIEGCIYTKENKLMAPLKAIVASMGINDYSMTYNRGKVVLDIKEERGTKKISLEVGQKRAKVDEKDLVLDLAPELKGGRVYVQVSKIAEILGGTISYYPEAEALQIDIDSMEGGNKEIKVLGEETKLKVGLKEQRSGGVCIKEGEIERLQKGRIEIKVEQPSYDWCSDEIILGNPCVEVIKGDIEIKSIGWDESNSSYIIEISKLSTKPSAIFINFPKVTIPRTIPEGYYGLQVSGLALGEKSFLLERFIDLFTPNTCGMPCWS